MSNIAGIIRAAASLGNQEPVNLAVCTVLSVNEEARVCNCKVISSTVSSDIDNVLLMPDIDDGMLLVPAIDSTVIVQWSGSVAPHIVMFSELSKIVQIVGDSGISIAGDKITINKGDYGGLVKVVELAKRLNKLENSFNELQAKYNTHVHAGVSTGSGSSAITTALSTSTQDLTQQDYIENKLIEHGSSI